MGHTKLVKVEILSIYKNLSGQRVNMPTRMALATEDTQIGIYGIRDEVAKVSGGKAQLVLSDLFRSYDMQYQAHHDYRTGKKKAYSPPPGGSFHEAGRAMDVSLGDLRGLPGDNFLQTFWDIAAKHGFVPIIKSPNPRASEAWHFDCRGEFQSVYEKRGYREAARAAILDIGQEVDDVTDDEMAWLQGQLTAFGIDVGEIDGILGGKTKAAIRKVKEDHGWKRAEAKYRYGPPGDPDSWEMPDDWLRIFLEAVKVGDVARD